MAELVVTRTLFLIGKHLVRFVYLFKFLLRLFTPGLNRGDIFLPLCGRLFSIRHRIRIYPPRGLHNNLFYRQPKQFLHYKLYVEELPLFKGEVKMQLSAYCLCVVNIGVIRFINIWIAVLRAALRLCVFGALRVSSPCKPSRLPRKAPFAASSCLAFTASISSPLSASLRASLAGINLSLFIGRELIAELINGLFGLINHLIGVVANVNRLAALFILRAYCSASLTALSISSLDILVFEVMVILFSLPVPRSLADT